MDLDVLYRIPKDIIWQHVKQFVPPQSVDIIIYKPCIDIYITKKTFWNALTRLKPEGLFCLECEPENVSNVIKLIEDSSYEYCLSYFIGDNRIAIYVLAYTEDTYKPESLKSYRISRWEEDVPLTIINLVSSNVIMLLGDATLPFIPIIKDRNKYIVAAGGDDIYSEIAKSEGIREIYL